VCECYGHCIVVRVIREHRRLAVPKDRRIPLTPDVRFFWIFCSRILRALYEEPPPISGQRSRDMMMALSRTMIFASTSLNIPKTRTLTQMLLPFYPGAPTLLLTTLLSLGSLAAAPILLREKSLLSGLRMPRNSTVSSLPSVLMTFLLRNILVLLSSLDVRQTILVFSQRPLPRAPSAFTWKSPVHPQWPNSRP